MLQKRRGAPRAPRFYIKTAFQDRLRSGREPLTLLSSFAGFPYVPFCRVLNSGVVPATPINIRRFEHLADCIGYPRDQIFEVTR